MRPGRPQGMARVSVAAHCLLAVGLAVVLLMFLVPAVVGEEREGPRPRVVAILPGHGGRDSGAVHRDSDGRVDLVEKEVNLAIARRLASRLEAAGYVAVLTRDGDYSHTPTPGNAEQEVQAHLDIANRAGADVLVAIHNNGYSDPELSGTTTYYCPKRTFAEKSRRLARAIHRHILSGLLDVAGYRARDHGVRTADYKPYGCLYTLGDDRGGTFRPSAMPGVVVEGLFVTNDFDAWVLSQEGGQDLIAAAIFDGIEEYFAVEEN